MTAKEFLRQYDVAERKIRLLEREYNEEQEMIDRVRSSADIDGMPHPKGITRSAENRVIRLSDKALRLNQARLEVIKIRQRVFDVVMQIDGPERELLYKRYIELKQWSEIQEELCYSKNGIHKVHNRALKMVDKKRGY